MSVSPFAHLALLLYVPLSAAVFALVRASIAVPSLMLGAAMFLPEGVTFDAPGIPPLDKYSISALCVLVGSLVVAKPEARSTSGRSAWFWICGGTLMIGIVATVWRNRSPVMLAPELLGPPMSWYDVASSAVRDSLWLLAPVLIGRVVFRSREALLDLVRVLVAAGLVYSGLMLLEVRLSPQLNVWVYGYHQHGFGQTLRFGGYRPMVFMAHGLAVAMLCATTVLAAVLLGRARAQPGARASSPIAAYGVALYLFVVLILAKSVGAILYAIAAIPLLLVARPKTIVRVAGAVAVVVLSYPVLRLLGWFPTDDLVALAQHLDADRAQSLAFRFDNEDLLLDKWREQPLFGWGGFGRSRIYDSSGRDISVTDGEWIIALGRFGLVRFFGEFALLLAPVLFARRKVAALTDPADRLLVSGFALVVVIGCVDLLPNGLFSHVPLLLSGALYGAVEGMTHGSPSLTVADRFRVMVSRARTAGIGAASRGSS